MALKYMMNIRFITDQNISEQPKPEERTHKGYNAFSMHIEHIYSIANVLRFSVMLTGETWEGTQQ